MNSAVTKSGGGLMIRVVEAAMVVIAARGEYGLESQFELALDGLERSLRDLYAFRAEHGE